MHQQIRVKRISGVFWIASLFVVLALFEGDSALAAGEVSEVAVAESPRILWKVQSPQNTIFLAGSIHVLQKHQYPLPQAFEEAFDQSSRVMFEVDLGGLGSPQAQMTMLQKGLYVNGRTLPAGLSSKNYAIAKAKLTELGLQIEDFHRMKPWLVSTTLMALELQKLGFEHAYGVDRYFYEKAKTAGKAIQGLETLEFQLNLFDRLPESVQEQFLLQTLEDLRTLDSQIDGMIKAWKEGNVQELEKLLKGISKYPELYQVLVVKRNKTWLSSIELGLLEKEPVLIVVGALHLLGKEGLVAMLKNKGYRVQQL